MHTDAELVELAAAKGVPGLNQRLVTKWAGLGLLPEAQRLSRGPGGGRGALYGRNDYQAHTFLQLFALHAPPTNYAAVANHVTAMWLYWDQPYISDHRQLLRVLSTWWQRADKVSQAQARAEAISLVRQVATRGTGDFLRRELKQSWSDNRTTEARSRDKRSTAERNEGILELVAAAHMKAGEASPLKLMGLTPEDVLVNISSIHTAADAIEAMLYFGNREPIDEHLCEQARMRLNMTAWHNLAAGTLDPMTLIGHACADLMVALGTHLIAHERGKPLPVPEIVPVIGEVAFLPVHNNDEFPNEGTSGIAEPEDIA